MFRLLETIKYFNGQFHNLEYHQRRMNYSGKELFGATDEINLSERVISPNGLSDSMFKVRVIYSTEIHDIEFHPYRKREINSLQIVHANEINYEHKYEDRSELQKFLCKSNADDVIIIKSNFVTDTSYSNIVLRKDKQFFTPKTFLLNGTKRQKLLHEKKIIETEVTLDDLKDYDKLFLINSMIDLEDNISIPTKNILGV